MLSLALSIVDNLLEPGDLDRIVVASFGDDFAKFMDEAGSGSGSGSINNPNSYWDTIYRRSVSSSDGQVKVNLYATVHRLRDRVDRKYRIGYVTYSLYIDVKTETADQPVVDIKVSDVPDEMLPKLAVSTYTWLTDTLPNLLDNRHRGGPEGATHRIVKRSLSSMLSIVRETSPVTTSQRPAGWSQV